MDNNDVQNIVTDQMVKDAEAKRALKAQQDAEKAAITSKILDFILGLFDRFFSKKVAVAEKAPATTSSAPADSSAPSDAAQK